MAPLVEEQCIPVKTDLDIVSARVEGRNLAKEMGFGTVDQARIATAISELARNIVLYAPKGRVTKG
jgi:serine/threonine-protein kinase RsbT